MATNIENTKIYTARAQHVLVTPRKANLLLRTLVGQPATLVLKRLAVSPKKAAEPVTKLVKQAIGNAVSTAAVSPDSLVIESAFATKGRSLKRARIGGRGRTKRYEKTASHLTLNLKVVETRPAPQPKKTNPAKTTPAKKETPKKSKVVKTKKGK